MIGRNSSFLIIVIYCLYGVACKNDTDFSVNKNQSQTNTSQSEDSESGGGEGTDESQNGTNESQNETAVEQTFSSTAGASLNLSMDIETQRVTTEFSLISEYNSVSRETKQITRGPIIKQYAQGSTGDPKKDELPQDQITGLIDILIVIDTSLSMKDEQSKISKHMPELLSHITDADWRIGITSTDPDDPCLHAVINKSDSDYEGRFRAAFDSNASRPTGYPNWVGISGSFNERGIETAIKGLDCNIGSSWLRPQSSVAVIIVSDERNCSNERTTKYECPYKFGSDLTDHLKDDLDRPLGTKARVFGLLEVSDIPRPLEYLAAINATEGSAHEIDDKDSYGQVFTAVSDSISEILQGQFTLSATPDANPVVVNVKDANGVTTLQTSPTDYTISGNTLTFKSSSLPPSGSTIIIEYNVNATPTFKAFTLNEVPEPGSVEVVVNGKVASDSNFPWTLNSTDVEFQDYPPNDASIVIRARKNTPYEKIFKLTSGLDAKKLKATKVTLGGAETSNYTYDPDNGTISFTTAPAEGVTIKVTYSEKLGDILEYDLALIGTNPSEFELTDKATGNKITNYTIQGTKVTLDASEHEEGRTLVLSYSNDDSSDHSIQLPIKVNASAISFVDDTIDCVPSVEGFELKFDGCDFGDRETIEIKIDTREKRLEFTIAGVSDPDSGTWTVLVNGKETSAFTREGSTIKFAEEDLEMDAEVTVRFAQE